MKEHLKRYFPDRFEDSDSFKMSTTIKGLLVGNNPIRRKMHCEAVVESVLQKSNEVKLLVGAMKKYGCNFNLARHVSCENCNECHGGFDPETKQIIVCQNTYITEARTLSILMHEMIHMFDYCRAKFDFDNLEHVACSEIRASNLTYCSFSDRLQIKGSGIFNIKKSHRDCVKQVAFRSVKAYSPETDDGELLDIVEKVFPFCYNDLEPFGRRGLNGSQDLRQSYRERYYYGYA